MGTVDVVAEEPIDGEAIIRLLDGRPKAWLARELGIDKVTLYRRLRGELDWTLPEAQRLAELFGIDPARLKLARPRGAAAAGDE